MVDLCSLCEIKEHTHTCKWNCMQLSMNYEKHFCVFRKNVSPSFNFLKINGFLSVQLLYYTSFQEVKKAYSYPLFSQQPYSTTNQLIARLIKKKLEKTLKISHTFNVTLSVSLPLCRNHLCMLINMTIHADDKKFLQYYTSNPVICVDYAKRSKRHLS